MESAGPSRLELVVLDWFKAWIGYPADAAGILVSGGSAADMTALACAREALVGAMDRRLVAYFPDQGHSSLARAARLLGFRPDQVRVLPTDGTRRLRPETLAAAVDADLAAGRRPLFASASAGATNTGAVDPLAELAAVCRDRGVWLHVDGAYGGFAALPARGRAALAGIEQADSVTLDPHKWLYQPFECGALLVREGQLLRGAFEIVPDYLGDAATREEEVNFSDLGLQLSRARALEIWLSISYFGLEAVRAEDAIAATNAALVAAWAATGRGLVSSTLLGGRYAVRLCPMNHTTRDEDVAAVLRFFAATPLAAPRRAAPAPEYARQAVLEPSGVGGERPGRTDAARIGLFAGLSADALARVTGRAHERHVEPGEPVIRRGTPGGTSTCSCAAPRPSCATAGTSPTSAPETSSASSPPPTGAPDTATSALPR